MDLRVDPRASHCLNPSYFFVQTCGSMALHHPNSADKDEILEMRRLRDLSFQSVGKRCRTAAAGHHRIAVSPIVSSSSLYPKAQQPVMSRRESSRTSTKEFMLHIVQEILTSAHTASNTRTAELMHKLEGRRGCSTADSARLGSYFLQKLKGPAALFGGANEQVASSPMLTSAPLCEGVRFAPAVSDRERGGAQLLGRRVQGSSTVLQQQQRLRRTRDYCRHSTRIQMSDGSGEIERCTQAPCSGSSETAADADVPLSAPNHQWRP